MPSAEYFPRLFTVEEANALLPRLRPLIGQVFHNLDHLRGRSQIVIQREGLNPESPDLMERLQRDDSIARVIQEVREMVQEINNHGCICKGVEQGLVDFPCLWGGEIVFLCWRYDEESVSHWHRIEDGFAGRRPLLESNKDDGTGNTSCH
jgi:hypothetical protein